MRGAIRYDLMLLELQWSLGCRSRQCAFLPAPILRLPVPPLSHSSAPPTVDLPLARRYNGGMGDTQEGIPGELVDVVRRLPRYFRLVWMLLRDPELPRKRRAALFAAIGYSLSPVDAVPGFIPVIGQLDDLAVLLLAVRWALRSLPPDRAETYLAQTELSFDLLDDDLGLVKRYGKRALRRAAAITGVAALVILGLGRLAGEGVARRLKERREA